MREIILDTETTGLDPKNGDRLIEIGCIELINRMPTGREYHQLINPEREVSAEAEAVHGISTAALKAKPLFADVAEAFLDFIGDDVLVIHNAGFDVAFLNAELTRVSRAAITMDRVIDTLMLARRKHPAGPNSLDALCKRYGIDNSHRTKHGAIIDCVLLADVYIELLGERQANLGLAVSKAGDTGSAMSGKRRNGAAKQRPEPLRSRLTSDEEAAHRIFIETLGPNALWHKYLGNDGGGTAG